MKTLKLEEATAKRLYATADNEFKTVLEETFGKEFFIPKKITDKIRTFDDVLSAARNWLWEQQDTKAIPVTKIQKVITTILWKLQSNTTLLTPEDKIRLISFVLNEGWEEDFSNRDQYKYYPRFERKRLGWVVHSCLAGYCNGGMGSGFYYKNSELALYAGNQFLDIYKEYLPE